MNLNKKRKKKHCFISYIFSQKQWFWEFSAVISITNDEWLFITGHLLRTQPREWKAFAQGWRYLVAMVFTLDLQIISTSMVVRGLNMLWAPRGKPWKRRRRRRGVGERWRGERTSALNFLPAKYSACVNGVKSLTFRKLIPWRYITMHGSLLWLAHPQPPQIPHVARRNDTDYYWM